VLREELVTLCRLAEASGRWHDMVELTTELVLLSSRDKESLSVEERNLVAVAFKGLAAGPRHALAALATARARATRRGEDEHVRCASTYAGAVRVELSNICRALRGLLSDVLMAQAHSSESAVFYLKLEGDYARYLAEAAEVAAESMAHARAARDAYERALARARSADAGLSAAHPIRLGLMLNMAVLTYEVEREPERALTMAAAALRQAEASRPELPTEMQSDTTLLLDLLRDNVETWTAAAESKLAAL
jgi:14-3-3 protein epsilon